MDFLAVIFYPIAAVVGLFITFRTKKKEGLVYGPLDKAGIATNIILTFVYGIFSAIPIFLGMIIRAYSDSGILFTILGYLFAALVAAAPVYCAIALGLSASLRRKGRSKAGFYVQFAGFLGLVMPILLALLLESADLPWLNTSLN